MSEFPRAKNGSLTLESWDLFVIRHQKPSNLAGHFVSFLMFYGGPIHALATGNLWGWLLFLASGGVGALSHTLTGDGRVNLHEATSSPRVVFYVTVMFWKVFRGTYRADIERANSAYKRLMALQVRSEPTARSEAP